MFSQDGIYPGRMISPALGPGGLVPGPRLRPGIPAPSDLLAHADPAGPFRSKTE